MFGSLVPKVVLTGAGTRVPRWSVQRNAVGELSLMSHLSNLAVLADNLTILWIDDDVKPDAPSFGCWSWRGFRWNAPFRGRLACQWLEADATMRSFVNLRLPDISGLDILEHLSDQGVTAPVLVLTGFGDFETAREAGRLGATHFLAKPVGADDLTTDIRSALAWRQARSQAR
jgi:DNA-binding NtrC family response regulator